MLPSSRRTFLSWLATIPVFRHAFPTPSQQPTIEVRPTALFQQPDGRKNMVRVTVAGLGAPAARARVTDRRGALVGTAGLLPAPEGTTLGGEVWEAPRTGKDPHIGYAGDPMTLEQAHELFEGMGGVPYAQDLHG